LPRVSGESLLRQGDIHAPHPLYEGVSDEAVRLAPTSGRSRREVAADLGIGLSPLRPWLDCRLERKIGARGAPKSELVWRAVFQTRAEVMTAIGRCIDGFDSSVRRPSTLDYVSPVQFERLTG